MTDLRPDARLTGTTTAGHHDHVGLLRPLALSLTNLGVTLSRLGRREEALAATFEAVNVRRRLAAANPAFLPDLAGALNNLGNRYSEVGRLSDAVAPTEEAVTAYRELAATNPALLPNLATSLNNLGMTLSNLERREDA